MSTVKLYQVMMDSDIPSKTFQLGAGNALTLANGTILEEGHEIVKKFPSYCVHVGEKVVEGGPELLNEDPIADAEPEAPVADAEPEVIAPEPEAPVVPEVKPEVKPAAKADTKPAAPAKK